MNHEVLPYRATRDFLSGALPFLRAGVRGGETVLAATGPGNLSLLRDGLGGDAAGVDFVEATEFYQHPARTLAKCVKAADELARRGQRLRLLGEPIWCERSPLEVAEWQRAEAIVNIAFAGTGASILCPYDLTLPLPILDGARRTHPRTVFGANGGYVDPWSYLSAFDHRPLPPAPESAESLRVDMADLFWLRAFVAEYGRGAGLCDTQIQGLLMSVTEVATNALRHGTPPVVLRLWTEPGDLICEVNDGGQWSPQPGVGSVPPETGAPGRFGLWAVRLLCSIVQVRTGSAGTTIRMRLPAAVV
jgi:anti-sigma regulatory factor (Ser/Thr protein kinase)